MITPDAQHVLNAHQPDILPVTAWVLIMLRDGHLSDVQARAILGMEPVEFELLRTGVDPDWLLAAHIARNVGCAGMGYVTPEQVLYALRGPSEHLAAMRHLGALVDELGYELGKEEEPPATVWTRMHTALTSFGRRT